jgi:hypothetical protein
MFSQASQTTCHVIPPLPDETDGIWCFSCVRQFQIAAPSLLLSKKSKPSNHSRPTRHGKPGPCSLDLPGLFPSPPGLYIHYIYKAMPAWQIVTFQLHSLGLDESTGRTVWYFVGTKCLGGLYLATGSDKVSMSAWKVDGVLFKVW